MLMWGNLNKVGVIWCFIPKVIWNAQEGFVEAWQQLKVTDLVSIPIWLDLDIKMGSDGDTRTYF